MSLGSKERVPSYEGLLLLCCAITCGCYLGSHIRVPVVPLFARTMGADTFQVGTINAAFLLMAALLSIPLGVLSDRLGRKRLIMGGLIIISLSSFLLCFSTSVLEMIGVYLLLGIGLAAFAPTMMSFVADFSPPTHLGRSYGWYTLALYGGMSTGPALGGAIAGWVSFQLTFVASGAITLAVFFIVVCFLPRARCVLVNRPSKRATGEVARDLAKNAPLLACWVATLGGCFGLGMFVTFVPLYAQDQGVTVEQIGLICGFQALCNALSRIPFGQLSDRVSKRSHLATAGFIGLSLSTAGLGMAHGEDELSGGGRCDQSPLPLLERLDVLLFFRDNCRHLSQGIRFRNERGNDLIEHHAVLLEHQSCLQQGLEVRNGFQVDLIKGKEVILQGTFQHGAAHLMSPLVTATLLGGRLLHPEEAFPVCGLFIGHPLQHVSQRLIRQSCKRLPIEMLPIFLDLHRQIEDLAG